MDISKIGIDRTMRYYANPEVGLRIIGTWCICAGREKDCFGGEMCVGAHQFEPYDTVVLGKEVMLQHRRYSKAPSNHIVITQPCDPNSIY